MTTLPQTTAARFPRAGGGRPPGIPALAQAYGGPAGGDAVAGGLTVSDVMRVLRANAWLIILCSLLSLIIGFVVNQYVFNPYFKEYTAHTVVEVQAPSIVDYASPVNGRYDMDKAMLEVRQKTIAQKVSSPDLWRPLLHADKGGIASTRWLSSFRDASGALDQAKAVEAIQKNLHVSPTPQTFLVNIDLDAPTPADAKFVLEAIVNVLINNENADVTKSGTEDRRALQNLSTRISTAMAGLDATINSLTSLLTSAKDINGQGDGINVARQMELQAQTSKRIEKESDFNKAEMAYQNFIKVMDAGGTPSMVAQEIEQNQSVQRATMDVDNAESALQAALQQYSPEHRYVKNIQASLDASKTQLEKKKEELRVSTGAMVRDFLSSARDAAKADIEDTNKKIGELEKTIGELNNEQLRYNAAKTQRDYLEVQKNKIDERLQVLDANASRASENRGTVRLLYTPEEPKVQSFPQLKVTMGAAFVLGLGFALSIAFLRELMDTSVRSPRDIARVGQINLLGMIPHTDDDPQAAAGDISLIISQEPHSIIAENFRQVRTRLQHTASLDTTRSLLVTSPGPGDGKTTIACNIAAGLALNGRKILLVDANFRRPALHTVFGVTNENGLGSVLTQASSAESVTHKTSVPNLDVLTTGPRPANTTELLESQLLTDFIDRALEEYDHVVFDAGPILLVSETVALAPRVDGVITVVRARANSRGLLQRMRDALRQLKAEHLGVVLNGVRQHSGGYYRRNIKNYYAYQNQD
jgi:polysaccharide biosynthesis transport protein